MGFGQSAVAATQVQSNIPVLQDALQYKNLKQDIMKNLDLLLVVNGHTQVMLQPGNEFMLKWNFLIFNIVFV